MELTLATLNAYWLFDNQKPLARWGAKLPDGGLQEKIDLIANAVLSCGPEGADIVALQEIEGPVVLRPLVKRLQDLGASHKHFWSSETLDPYTGQNVAVISRFPASIAPVTRLDQTVLAYSDHRNREKLGSLGKFLRVDLEIGEEVLSVFVAHLKSRRGGTQETRLLRNVQAQIVRNFSRPRVEQGNSRNPSFTAILGDMNDEPQTEPLDIMMGKHDTSYNLISATQDLPIDEQWTYEYEGEKQQLDHILLSKFTYERMKSSGITRLDRKTSDHDAVWSVINLST